MSSLRHDLKTSGWSMMDTHGWIGLLNEHWFSFRNKLAPEHVTGPLKSYVDEMSWLLHEALPEEWFYLETVEIRADGQPHWHVDGGYLRVLFTIRGYGTVVARSFENNVPIPPGYALIMTGQQRMWRTGIPETWHTAPSNNGGRRLILLNFRNAS